MNFINREVLTGKSAYAEMENLLEGFRASYMGFNLSRYSFGYFFCSNSLILLWQVTRESECTQLILWSAKMYIHRHGQLRTFVKVCILIRDDEYGRKKNRKRIVVEMTYESMYFLI